MNLWGDMVNFKEDYGKEYYKSISSYSKNSLIYSDEPYEFRIISSTPDGKIVLRNDIIHFPYEAKEVAVEKASVIIKDSKIVSIEEIEKDNNKYIEVKINYMITFNVRIYDKRGNICKIKCYLDKYPTPNKKSFIKEFIRVYSIITTELLINCDNNISYKNIYEPKISLWSKASIQDIENKLCKERKFIGCYDVNCEDYMSLIVGIVIYNRMKISLTKKVNEL